MNRAERRRHEHFAQQKLEDRLGDAPIEAKYYEQMAAIVHTLDEMFNGKAKGNDRQTGFVLMVFPFNDFTGRCNYASNGANRQDVVTLMKEMIARFEGQHGGEEGHA